MFPDNSHVVIGGQPYKLDESLAKTAGIMPYRHYSRSLFPDVQFIPGKPGSRNLRQERLIWEMTDFAGGEGQTVLDGTDDDSVRSFYSSETLNFRVPGQFSLNPSALAQRPALSGAGSIINYSGASFGVVSGAAGTVMGTELRLENKNDIAGTSVTPGASSHQVDFNAYVEVPVISTVEGNTMTKLAGDVSSTGSDKVLSTPGSSCGTDPFTNLDPTITYEFRFWLFASDDPANQPSPKVVCKIVDTTPVGDTNIVGVIVQSDPIALGNVTTAMKGMLTFKPKSGHRYEAHVVYTSRGANSTLHVRVDRVDVNKSQDPNDAMTVSVYNVTDSVEVTSTPAYLTNTTSSLVASLGYDAVAGKTYSYRVLYLSGSQRPILSYVTDHLQSGTSLSYDADAVELGMGGNIWLAQSSSASTPRLWTYDFTGESFVERVNIVGEASGKKVIGLCHSDKYEYVLTDSGKIWACTTSTATLYANAPTATPRGMCICQNRLFVLGEDATNGLVVYIYAVDSAAPPVSPLVAGTAVASLLNTPDATLRNRMVATPNGARFIVNEADVTGIVYESDSSGSSPITREIARMEPGVKLTAIEYTASLTFLTGEFKAETGHVARSALWMLDANNIPQRIGIFRQDAPEPRFPCSMQGYQNDLWILQGSLIWRYSLMAPGGLFLESRMDATPANARDIAVLQGHQFVAYANEHVVWVTGSVASYSQSGAAGSRTWTSSVYDYGLAGYRMMLTQLQLITNALPVQTAATVEYQIDQDGTWRLAGTASEPGVSKHNFSVSVPGTVTDFSNLQARVTLRSLDGTKTPEVKAVIANGLLDEDEEFFDLRLLCFDSDAISYRDRISSVESTGGSLAQSLWDLKNSESLTTLLDGFEERSRYEEARSYLVRVEKIEQDNLTEGEGTLTVTLRVMSDG